MHAPSVNHRRAGIAYPLLAISFTVLVAFVAFGVDVGYVAMTKTELQSTIDAAGLAGASGLPISSDEVRLRAKNIAQQNSVAGHPLILQNSDIEFGLWDRSTRSFTKLAESDEYKATAVRVTGGLTQTRGNPLKLVFAPIIGFDSTNLTASTVAGFAQAADVVLIQDITSSFSDELADAKVGDQALLDALYADGVGRSNFGIVVHTGWGKTLAPLQPILTNYTNLSNIVSGIEIAGSSGMPVTSGTDIAAGLEEGTNVFNDTSYVAYPNTIKAIVLVSDGEPTASNKGSHPALNATQLLQLAKDKADEAWAQRIHVYVVFFNRNNNQIAAANVASLTRGNGDFVQVNDAKLLPDALQKLTRRLPMALLK